MSDAPAPLTLDQLLVEEAQRPAVGIKSNPFADAEAWATPGRVAAFRDVAAQSELTLDRLLGSLELLFGAPCLVRVRAEVETLESLVHSLADVTIEGLALAESAGSDRDALVAARERARSVVVLLEGALSAADERERRVRGVLADVVRDGVNGDAADVTPEAREAHVHIARRLGLALDFDGPADPAQITETSPETSLGQ